MEELNREGQNHFLALRKKLADINYGGNFEVS